jgi:hypothetical protein
MREHSNQGILTGGSTILEIMEGLVLHRNISSVVLINVE